MECKFIGVRRVKLFVSGRKDFLYFDLPNNTRAENVKSIVSLMYGLDSRFVNLFHNNVPLDDFRSKTLEQISKHKEVPLILVFKNPGNVSKTSRNLSQLSSIDTDRSNKRSKSPTSTRSYSSVAKNRPKSLSKNDNKSFESVGSSVLKSKQENTYSPIKITTATSKANYILKKDMQNIQKEVDFIKKNLKIFNDFEGKSKSLDTVKTCDKIIANTKENLDALREEMMRNDEELRKNFDLENVQIFGNVKKEIAKYNEEVRQFLESYQSFSEEIKGKDIDHLSHASVSSRSKYLWQYISDLRALYLSINKKLVEVNKMETAQIKKDYIKIFQNINETVGKHYVRINTQEQDKFNESTNQLIDNSEADSSREKSLSAASTKKISMPSPDTSIMTIKENTNLVFIYQTIENKLKSMEVNFPPTSKKKFFFWNCRLAQNKHNLYITGGHDDLNNGVKSCYHFNHKQDSHSLSEIKYMNYSHWGHSTIYVAPRFLFVISGSYTKKCEYFDSGKKNWVSISDINNWRMDATVFNFNNYLYVFGGWNNSCRTKDPFIEKVERIKIFSPINENFVMTTNKWEIVRASNVSLLKKTCMAMLKVYDNKFILLGGDTSDYLKENFENNSAGKIRYHTSALQVKINYVGACEIEEKTNFKLTKPSCFTLTKEFMPINDILNKFGCFNHAHETLFVQNEKGEFLNEYFQSN